MTQQKKKKKQNESIESEGHAQNDIEDIFAKNIKSAKEPKGIEQLKSPGPARRNLKRSDGNEDLNSIKNEVQAAKAGNTSHPDAPVKDDDFSDLRGTRKRIHQPSD